MVYPIVVYGDPILRKRAKEIEKGSLDLKAFVQDMYETMYAAHGIGLAAPQIGKGVRLFVVDGTTLDDIEEDMTGFKKVFINPEIIKEEGDKWEFEEGCLSIPNIRENVARPEKLKVIRADADEQARHAELVEHLQRASGGKAVWSAMAVDAVDKA